MSKEFSKDGSFIVVDEQDREWEVFEITGNTITKTTSDSGGVTGTTFGEPIYRLDDGTKVTRYTQRGPDYFTLFLAARRHGSKWLWSSMV